MSTKHIRNEGASPIYVGGKMIPPGEGRDFDERDLPPELRDAPLPAPQHSAPSLDDELGELLKEPAKEIVARLSALTNEALERLAEMERGQKAPRKRLLEALADEALRRADAALQDGAPGADAVADAAADDVNAGV